MTVIFKVKSQEAYIIKILAELLANNIKTGCFEIDVNGISLCMMDHHRKILIDLKLFANKFSTYKFNSKKMFLGINLNHLHKMLKSVKKKDSIELFIDDTSPNDLGIKVIPKDTVQIDANRGNVLTFNYIKKIKIFGKDTILLENREKMKKAFRKIESGKFILEIK